MKTECRILTYDFNNTSLEKIQDDIEKYCNKTFFTIKAVKSLSCVSKNDKEENYIVNVIYENQIRWIRVLIIVLLITYLFISILFTFNHNFGF